jgi:hypothetical protein
MLGDAGMLVKRLVVPPSIRRPRPRLGRRALGRPVHREDAEPPSAPVKNISPTLNAPGGFVDEERAGIGRRAVLELEQIREAGHEGMFHNDSP